MFESTLPADGAELMHLSDFQRQHEGVLHDAETEAGATLLTSLNASLLQDLMRFDPADDAGAGLEALEVLAAAVRHGRPLLLHLQYHYRVIPLTVFAADGSLHCALPLQQLLALELGDLRVLHVEPARLRPLASGDAARVGEPRQYADLSPLLWELALRGARETLLPEIAGPAAYRVAPGSALHRLGLSGSLEAAVEQLRRRPCNVTEIASWPGFDRERAKRLLNGLYLHAALIVSRTHPAAINEGLAAGAP
jgi:hypothetical protein